MKRCEVTQQSLAVKSTNLVRLMKKEWTACGVRLQEGKYTLYQKSYGFDGPSLLKMVSKYRRCLAWRSEHVRTKINNDMKQREPRMHWFLFTDDTGRAHGQNTAFPYIDPQTGSHLECGEGDAHGLRIIYKNKF